MSDSLRQDQRIQEPQILIPPVEGRPLIMYLTVLENSMGCVLGQHDESGRKEHAICYLSKKFTDYETRYSLLEKNLLRFGMGCSSTKTVYVDSYHFIDF